MLKESLVREIISEALSTGGDFAEVFVEKKFNTSINLIGGNVEKSISGIDYGVGIRIFDGTNSIYAYTNDDSKDNLLKVAKEASNAIDGVSERNNVSLTQEDVKSVHPIEVFPETVSKADKISLMKRAYEAAKSYDEVITQVTVNYLDNNQEILIANSEGLYKKDRRIRTRLSVTAVASNGEEMQRGRTDLGGHYGFEYYKDQDIEATAKEAGRIAKTMLSAKKCPSGKMPVIINDAFGGVIFHEACGHGLEATSVAKGTSVYTDKIGEKIASDLVTAIDDGTIPNAWGSQNIDDEGNPTQKNVLIKDGILKGYMIDKLNGKRMGMPATGSSRRQSYKYAPTSRMTNTYIDNGDSSFEEIIANTEYGLFAKYLGGGSVNPATGDFNFAVMEGYMVRDGKIAEPVRGATLIGTGLEVLKKIDMVGNNLSFGHGMCGSVSGSIPADVGQPTIRVSEMTVGGSSDE